MAITEVRKDDGNNWGYWEVVGFWIYPGRRAMDSILDSERRGRMNGARIGAGVTRTELH